MSWQPSQTGRVLKQRATPATITQNEQQQHTHLRPISNCHRNKAIHDDDDDDDEDDGYDGEDDDGNDHGDDDDGEDEDEDAGDADGDDDVDDDEAGDDDDDNPPFKKRWFCS